MKKEIEKLIPKALAAVSEFLLKNGTTMVQKEYSGYAASLGAALRTSGLVASITFYTDVKRSSGNARRYKLLQAIAYTLGHEVGENKRFLQEKILADLYEDRNMRGNARSVLIAPNGTAKKRWEKDIAYASIALKLAMRNFEHSKEE